MRYSAKAGINNTILQLSFIIPVFGVEKYISRCLDSIYSINLSQDEYEVICIDDCSKDSSVQIIEQYQVTHPNLVLLHHSENRRQGGARNTGIRSARGEFIIFVDADDFISKYDLAGLLSYMRDNDLDLLLGAADIVSEEGYRKRWGNAPNEESPIMTGPDLFTDEYIHKVAFGVVWLGIYRRELVGRVKPFVEKVPYEDADWTLQCAYLARRAQYKPVVIYNYFLNQLSTTHRLSIQSVIDRIRQGLRVWEWAQTVTENRDAVILAVKEYCVYNLQVLLSLWKYRRKEREELFKSFPKEEWDTVRNWFDGRNILSFFFHFPFLSRVGLTILSPFLRIGVKIKNCFK